MQPNIPIEARRRRSAADTAARADRRSGEPSPVVPRPVHWSAEDWGVIYAEVAKLRAMQRAARISMSASPRARAK